MYDTEAITRSINGLSRRTLARRIGLHSNPAEREKIALARLNGSLARLDELLYESFNDITEEDYLEMAPYLTILIDSGKSLISSYRKSPHKKVLREQITELLYNIDNVAEMDHDLRVYKHKLPHDEEFQKLFKEFSDHISCSLASLTSESA